MQQAGVCCRPAGAGRSSGGTRTGRRHRFSSRFEAISRALQPGSKHAQPGVRTSTCTCTYNRWVWGGIKKKICRIRPLLLCGCVVHLLNYHWAGYEENLIVEKKTAPPHHVELAVGFQKETRCLPWRPLWWLRGRVVRLLLVLSLALEVPSSSIRRPSPFGPSFLFLFAKVKNLTSPGLEPLMTGATRWVLSSMHPSFF